VNHGCSKFFRVIALIFAAALATAPAISAKTMGDGTGSSDLFGANWVSPDPLAFGLSSLSPNLLVSQQSNMIAATVLPNSRQLRLRLSALLGSSIAYVFGGDIVQHLAIRVELERQRQGFGLSGLLAAKQDRGICRGAGP
jgi:hypothetical protein